jgi:GxxExxY protein
MKQENSSTENSIDPLTERVIGAAIQVHRELGPGFLQSVYEEALAFEFAESGLCFQRHKPVPVLYREHHVGEHRLNFLVEGVLIVDLKAVAALENIHFAIVRSQLKAANIELALVLNFASAPLTIKRVCRDYTRSSTPQGIHV